MYVPTGHKGILTIEHNRTNLRRNPIIPRLLPQLPHCTLRRGLPLIYQTRRHFDRDFIDRRTKLLLEQ